MNIVINKKIKTLNQETNEISTSIEAIQFPLLSSFKVALNWERYFKISEDVEFLDFLSKDRSNEKNLFGVVLDLLKIIYCFLGDTAKKPTFEDFCDFFDLSDMQEIERLLNICVQNFGLDKVKN